MGKASRRKKEHRRGGAVAIIEDLPGSIFKNAVCIDLPKGYPKISEALIELVEPYLTGEEDLQSLRELIAVAATVWNLSLLEDDCVEDLFEEMEIDETEGGEEIRARLLDLIDRKRFLFPDDFRVVGGWDVRLQQDGQFFVKAVATFPEE